MQKYFNYSMKIIYYLNLRKQTVEKRNQCESTNYVGDSIALCQKYGISYCFEDILYIGQ